MGRGYTGGTAVFLAIGGELILEETIRVFTNWVLRLPLWL